MDGHRGTGGRDGQEQGGIVAELKSQLPNVMYAGRLGIMSRHRGAGRGMYVCMYVHVCILYDALLTAREVREEWERYDTLYTDSHPHTYSV